MKWSNQVASLVLLCVAVVLMIVLSVHTFSAKVEPTPAHTTGWEAGWFQKVEDCMADRMEAKDDLEVMKQNMRYCGDWAYAQMTGK